MYGEKKETRANEKMLLGCHKDIYAKNYGFFNKKLKEVLGVDWNIHFAEDVPNTLIKESLEAVGIPCDYLQEYTDGGSFTKSQTDGGVVYISNKAISVPITWVETKSSNSIKNSKSRGQASGLIAEQYSWITSWTELVDNKIFPLIAFCYGADYDGSCGSYNIRRICADLHTKGNCNPYEMGYHNSAWYFYKEKFTKDEMENIIATAMKENFERALNILKKKRKNSVIYFIKNLLFN